MKVKKQMKIRREIHQSVYQRSEISRVCGQRGHQNEKNEWMGTPSDSMSKETEFRYSRETNLKRR